VVLDLVLYVVDGAGADVREIASTSGGWFSDFSPPSWSKDGEELAAVIEQWGAGPHDVYVVAADGSSQVNITNDGQSEHPAWSPHGTEIAFTSHANGASIDAVRSDGSHRRVIADLPTGDFWPQWSPNGSSLLFSSYDGANFLVLVHITKAHGKQIIDLPNASSICDAVWSPDGKDVLFVDSIGELWTVDSRVRTEPSPLGLVGWLPSWQATRKG
jgi:TolB protein